MLNKKQFTVRMPGHLYEFLIEKASQDRKSVNDILVQIIEEHAKLIKAEHTLKKISALRKKTKTLTGVQPDSTDEIRELREGYRNDESLS